MRIDNLQYCNWSEKIFRQMREGDVDAVHVTIAYHENFRETVLNFEAWNRWFELYPDLITKGLVASDIDAAKAAGKTAIFFGFQNPSPIEDDIGLVEVVHTLGARFMQLTYNNQSLLATGCYEAEDAGITRMGRQVIKEMNRVGPVVDMSHSAARSTIEAAETYGTDRIGIGSDLCQDQPDSVVEWMRVGRWSKEIDYGEGSASAPGFLDLSRFRAARSARLGHLAFESDGAFPTEC
jgi:microsomal dipeptidase-like Zn-dependent dipeptidase